VLLWSSLIYSRLMHANVKASLTQNATKHSFPCYAAKSCPLVNDCEVLAGFSDFYLPLLFYAFIEEIPLSYPIRICCGKTRMAGLQSGKCRIMIDSVVWAQCFNATDTRHTDRQPHRHSKCHANASRQAIKIKQTISLGTYALELNSQSRIV